MNRRTTCLLRRLMIGGNVSIAALRKTMKSCGLDYTEEEIAEVTGNKPQGDRVFVLHGYWNTPDADGVQIIKTSYDFEAVEKRLNEITESHASEFVSLLEENWQASGGDRFYEITDGDGNYAKFYITEEVTDYECNAR